MYKINKLIIHLAVFCLLSVPLLSPYTISSETFFKDQKQHSDKINPLLYKHLETIPYKDTGADFFIKTDSHGYIHVYLHLKYIDDNVLSRLEDSGFEIEIINNDFDIIQGWVGYDSLVNISGLDFIEEITPPVYGILRQGSVTTEGDMVMNSDTVRDDLGLTGQGVRVGVISNGIDSLSVSQSTGDLPSNICIVDPGNGDEGTALLETVYDIAPGAHLSFSEGFSSSLAFMKSIDDLIDICNVDIIVDDVGFLLEPYFEDGLVAQKVDEAVSRGIIFISAAGNSADEHYQKQYFDEDMSDNGLNLHDFGQAAMSTPDLSMPLLVGGNQFKPNNFIAAILQWNDPFGLSGNDYDLYLLDEDNNILDSSINAQNGDDNPIEVVIFENNTDGIIPVKLVINKFSGEHRILELNFNGIISVQDYNVPEDSIFGHPAAKGAISVAAAPFSNPDIIQDYSSRGPVSIIAGSNAETNDEDLFISTNTHYDIDIRQKPTITGIDGTSTSLPDFTPFFGTSVAAPHIAGVIALMLEASPSLLADNINTTSNFQITRSVNDIDAVLDILKSTSIDLGTPGDDTTYGFGRIDALAAVEETITRFGDNDGQPPDPDEDMDDNGNDGSNGGGGCNISSEGGNNYNLLGNILLVLFTISGSVIIRKFRKNNEQ